MKQLVVMCLLVVAGCDSLPQDPGKSSKRIEATGRFSVGLVDPDLRRDPHLVALVRRLERMSGARAEWRAGSGETLLSEVKRGDVDLAVGRFSEASPWTKELAMGPPLVSSGPPDEPLELKAVMRNGENRWIMTVERASRAVAGEVRGR